MSKIVDPELDAWIDGIVVRDEFLQRNSPPCPKCETRQVQLTNKAEPASWRCRECNFQWRQEPSHF